MVKILKNLKRNYGVSEVKMEFEAEATRLNEAMRLKEIATSSQCGLVVKIGGPEAITDMLEAQHLGASLIVAPMIESSYAMEKYIQAVEKHFSDDLIKNVHFGFNLETYQAYKNLDEILNTEGIKRISALTLGRVDLTGSMGLTRKEINSDKIFKIAEDVFRKSRKKGLKTTMGGGISIDAIPFIKKLTRKKLLDRFETRKIVFEVPKRFNEKKVKESISNAVEFELLWLRNKKNHYSAIACEDDTRIEMIEKRRAKK